MIEDLVLNSRHFVRYQDPASGVASYLLNTPDCPYTQNLYFVNDSFGGGAEQGNYLWFSCRFPPSTGAFLGVLDVRKDEIIYFPQTQFLDASPAVDPVTGEAYFFSGVELYRIHPEKGTEVEFINRIPEEISKRRPPIRCATHITFSPRGDTICVDPGFGRDFYIGELPLDGGDLKIWRKIDFYTDHAQFSPVDPDLILFANDGCRDVLTGEQIDTRKRMWLIRRGGDPYPVFPDFDSPMHGHEWWGKNGKSIYFVHYGQGVFRFDLEKNELVKSYPTSHPVSHSYSTADDRYLVSDVCPAERDYIQVILTDLKTGKETFIASRMPKLNWIMSHYHCHAHPRFSVNDKFVSWTAMYRGRPEVAVTPTAGLF